MSARIGGASASTLGAAAMSAWRPRRDVNA
jgi:hypothetical protein